MFNIQMFADTVTSSSDLKVGLQFADADTRLITIPNPKATLTNTDITTAFSSIITNNIFVGDKAGAAVTGLYTAYKDQTVRTKLDISGS